MSSKQRKALAVLIVSALAGLAAAYAPGQVSCEVDPELVEDLLPAGSSDEGGGSSESSSSG